LKEDHPTASPETKRNLSESAKSVDKPSSSSTSTVPTGAKPTLASTSSLVSASRAWLAARDQRRAERRRRLWEQAKQDADRIIAMIVREFRPARIYQWGSIVYPEHFAEYSDIDIAVEGLPGGAAEYFRLLAEAERLTSFPIDIVELEHIEPEFARLIRSQGRLRHEH